MNYIHELLTFSPIIGGGLNFAAAMLNAFVALRLRSRRNFIDKEGGPQLGDA